jgi:hypothetical protein
VQPALEYHDSSLMIFEELKDWEGDKKKGERTRGK